MLSKSPLWKQPPILDVDLKLSITSRNKNLTADMKKINDKSKWEPPDKSMPSDILETIQNINTDITK